MRFDKDGSILLKNYPKNCKGSKPNKNSNIMITYDENTFLSTDEQ